MGKKKTKSKDKDRKFKSIEEYQKFYANPQPGGKKNNNKYYRMGQEAVKLAVEKTLGDLSL